MWLRGRCPAREFYKINPGSGDCAGQDLILHADHDQERLDLEQVRLRPAPTVAIRSLAIAAGIACCGGRHMRQPTKAALAMRASIGTVGQDS